MRFAIGGSHGFIGTALSQALRSEGHEVHPMVRHAPRQGEIGVDLARRELDCSQIDGHHIGAVDVVVNLIGEPLTPNRWDAKKREAIRSSRIGSTDLIARAIATAPGPPKAFITMSAVGYYGNRGGEILTEQSTAGENFLAQVCRAWEASSAPARAVGVRVVHARAGIVLGHGGGILAALVPLFRLGLGGPLGDGSQWMSPISLTDAVRGLTFMATNDTLNGACNLTSPNPLTNRAFTKALGRSLHRPALLAVPAPVIRLALGRRTAESLPLASQRAIPALLERSGFEFRHPGIEDALGAALSTAQSIFAP